MSFVFRRAVNVNIMYQFIVKQRSLVVLVIMFSVLSFDIPEHHTVTVTVTGSPSDT